MADTPHPSSVAGRPLRRRHLPVHPRDRRSSIDPRLALHTDWTDKVDPITYEVVRHHLWNINEELGMTIQRISGSPVAMYAFDLNSSIFTEDGEFIYYGPYQLYMSGVSDVQVKWTLEHRSANPGIFDGRHVPLERSLGGRGPPDGRHPALPGLLGGQALLLDHQRAAPVRRGRHHPGQLLPQCTRHLRRGHPHPARQDHRARRAAPRHRGRSTCAPRASPIWWPSISAPRSPAT